MAPVPDPVHPIRRPELQEQMEAWTETFLREVGGSGKVIFRLEVDYKDERPIGYRLEVGGERYTRLLTSGGRTVVG